MELEVLDKVREINDFFDLDCEIRSKSINYISHLKGEKRAIDVRRFKKKCPWHRIHVETSISFPVQFLDYFKDKIIWRDLLCEQQLPLEFLDENMGIIAPYLIFRYQQVSEDFIEKKDKEELLDQSCWSMISQHQKLSEAFMDRHKALLDWSKLSIFQQMSEKFIEKHEKRVSWNSIFIYQKNLSESFKYKYGGRRY